MSKTTTFDKITLSEELDDYLSELDSYDQPYFLLLNSDADVNKVNEIAIKVIKAEDSVSEAGSSVIDKDLLFITFESESEPTKAVVNKIISELKEQNIKVFISVFAHNCLGDAKETFKWGTQLLDEVIENADDNSSVSFNDFTDRDNWPGVSKYR